MPNYSKQSIALIRKGGLALMAFLLFGCSMNLIGDGPFIVAHRGASGDAPENSLTAFKLAWEQGADAIEGDFSYTADGQIVCFHDSTTKKFSAKNVEVRKSTLAELRALDVSKYFKNKTAVPLFPTFKEVLATIPAGKKIFIEIKSDPGIVPALIKELDQSGLQPEQIVVICFKKEVLQALKAKAPQYKLSWLCSFKKNKAGEMAPSSEEVLETLKFIGSQGFSSNSAIPESTKNLVLEQGYEWHVWTVNKVSEAQRFKEWGVFSITTDYPGKIIKGLAEATERAL